MKLVHHHLVSVNLTKKKIGKLEPMTGVFKYRTNKSPEWIQVVVSISPLLASRMQTRHKRDKLPVNVPYIDHEFTTVLNSRKYSDSPFRLIKFVPSGESDIPLNYHLECVDEWGKSIFDTDLQEVVGYQSGFLNASKFIRYQVRKFTKMFVQLEEGTVIAKHDMQRIAVK